MVIRKTAKGTVFHEPPYTLDEQLELAKRVNGKVRSFSSLQNRHRPEDRTSS